MTRLAILSAFFLALAGCAAGASTPSGCTQTPEPPYPQLLYPMDGATGVSTPTQTVVLAFTGDPAVYGSPGLSVSSATVGPLQAPPSPLPSPMVSPPPGTTVLAASVGSLQPHTQYAVFYQSNAVCVPPGAGTRALHSIGSFTTQ